MKEKRVFDEMLESGEYVYKTIKPVKRVFLASKYWIFVWLIAILIITHAIILAVPVIDPIITTLQYDTRVLYELDTMQKINYFMNKYYWKIEEISKLLTAFLAVLIIAFIMPKTHYKNHLYCITNRRIIVRYGMIGKRYTSVEFENIAEIDIHVGFFDKRRGKKTGTLEIQMIRGGIGFDGVYLSKKVHLYNVRNPKKLYSEIKDLI